jgi:hypothetical protein
MWKFEDDCDPGLNRQSAIKIKAGLEELAYIVHGVARIDVCIDPLPVTSDADIALDAAFETREALEAFLDHEATRALDDMIKSCTDERMCTDCREPLTEYAE